MSADSESEVQGGPPPAPYDQLASRVDVFHERVSRRFPDALSCARGCSQCCHQHLSVMPLEWARVEAAVRALPAASRDAIAARLAAGRADPRCPLLDDGGACRTYAARPMICRSHGLPVTVDGRRDVCPLNFPAGPGVGELPDDVVLDVGHVNVVLGVISRVGGVELEPRVDLFEGLAQLLAAPDVPVSDPR